MRVNGVQVIIIIISFRQIKIEPQTSHSRLDWAKLIKEQDN